MECKITDLRIQLTILIFTTLTGIGSRAIVLLGALSALSEETRWADDNIEPRNRVSHIRVARGWANFNLMLHIVCVIYPRKSRLSFAPLKITSQPLVRPH